jgi:hypothetical protein
VSRGWKWESRYLVKGGGTWGSVSWMVMEEYILVNGMVEGGGVSLGLWKSIL